MRYFYILRNIIFGKLYEWSSLRFYELDTDYHVAYFSQKYFKLIPARSYIVWYIDTVTNDVEQIFLRYGFLYTPRFLHVFEHQNKKYILVIASIPKKEKSRFEELFRRAYGKIVFQEEYRDYDKFAGRVINGEEMNKMNPQAQ